MFLLFFHHVSALCCQCTSTPYTHASKHHIFQSTIIDDSQLLYISRSPASPSWLDEAGPSPIAGHQLPGAAQVLPTHLQKSITASTINSYIEGSDTRSISNDPSNTDQHQHQQANGTITSVVGGGGKLGYNNNQYVSGAHLGESSEIMLGHIDDTIGHKQQQNDHKSDQVDYGEQEGGGETETKSLSSVKSGGSNADARYLLHPSLFSHFPLLFHCCKTFSAFYVFNVFAI